MTRKSWTKSAATALLMGASPVALAAVFTSAPAAAQLAVVDPTNLIQNALIAARTLQQVNNQIEQIANQVQSLQNEALHLRSLGRSVAPDLMWRLGEMDALINEARGIALEVQQTRAALDQLFTGSYASTDVAARAGAASAQIEATRAALRTSLLLQAQTVEQIRQDRTTLSELAQASSTASGALSAQQATNELLAFQAEQSMRLQALLATSSRADALRQAREMEALAQARAQHAHFFSGASQAHPGQRPWN